MAKVELRRVTKTFTGGVTAVDGLDLTIEEGEFFALLGPSGCGKTTLLRMIAGLESPTTGTIWIDGTDVTHISPGNRDVAMVFQDYALYPHMTVADNISYPLKVRKVAKEERHQKAAEVGASLQLQELLDRRPGQLSGGQQQRVAVARAVAYEPRLFLFDEPLSNLDARLRLEARTFLKRLQKELGVTALYVTHDQSEALALADRIAVMKDGRIMQLDTPAAIYNRPTSLFVASFIGSVPMNLLSATVDGDLGVGSWRLPVPAEVRGVVSDGQEVVVGIRPEHARLVDGAGDARVTGAVSVVELLGNEYLVTVEDGGRQFQAVSDAAPDIGDRRQATFAADRALLYRASDGALIAAESPAAERRPSTA
jgi:multiple sugar transport system ATP-binding protein